MTASASVARWLTLGTAIVALMGCAPQMRSVAPNWDDPGERLVGAEVWRLLRAAELDPRACAVVFLESEDVNAASLGNCTFGFTRGLAATRDGRLIAGLAAHEVAHEALAHRRKIDAAVATLDVADRVAAGVPGPPGLYASLGIFVASALIMPAYSRSLEADADAKALEILSAAHDPDAAGTMIHALEALRAREGSDKGGPFASHPDVSARLAAMRERQAREPTPQVAAAATDEPVDLDEYRTADAPVAPADPRAAWSERYKRMVAAAEASERGAVDAPGGTPPAN